MVEVLNQRFVFLLLLLKECRCLLRKFDKLTIELLVGDITESSSSAAVLQLAVKSREGGGSPKATQLTQLVSSTVRCEYRPSDLLALLFPNVRWLLYILDLDSHGVEKKITPSCLEL